MALACKRRRFSGRCFPPPDKLLFEMTTRYTSAFTGCSGSDAICRWDWHKYSSVSILVNLWKQPFLLAIWVRGDRCIRRIHTCVCFCLHKKKTELILKFLKHYLVPLWLISAAEHLTNITSPVPSIQIVLTAQKGVSRNTARGWSKGWTPRAS